MVEYKDSEYKDKNGNYKSGIGIMIQNSKGEFDIYLNSNITNTDTYSISNKKIRNYKKTFKTLNVKTIEVGDLNNTLLGDQIFIDKSLFSYFKIGILRYFLVKHLLTEFIAFSANSFSLS